LQAVVQAGYEIDDDPERVDFAVVWSFLSREAYWARWRTPDDVSRQIADAWRVVGAYKGEEMVGFARAVSDGVALAYLANLFVVAPHRGVGLGYALASTMIEDGRGAGFRWLLHTADAHGLYAKLGFSPPDDMLLERPNQLPTTT
jgi:GNAT superfamily N-acetyltransferase